MQESAQRTMTQQNTTQGESAFRYLQFVMMHGQLCRVPDDGGDRVTLLQRLADQILTSLPGGSQHSNLHRYTLIHRDQSELKLIKGQCVKCSDLSS